ncbi:TIGR01459 family HAD-type hydrolase [Caenispirillum bisanense]|uniref:HAD-superfamily class IIA hydrolase, TIGR01459 n=1 Tax=Caenispirillum bisanense TaxID=414052 RepID=A0A286GLW8_9PROT|nr:TIGR01459 family HAD-type hydrolase [Caenispirillum bisanense]SOD96510.1 HAD-superfamily class IIA hydrolase, TIGR01459 [Caenispirillum bisanense]
MPETIPGHSGLRALADRYDAFILDLWGVVHDGQTPYPDAVATLAALKDAGKPVIMLSNAPRRSVVVENAMTAMGIDRALYDQVLSSGEAVRMELERPRDPFYAGLGDTVYYLGRRGDESVLEGLPPFRMVDDPAEASWILDTGPRSFEQTLDDLEPELRALAARKLPLVCANPDRVVIRAGKRILCAGAMADRYEELGGGPVSWRGKPDPAVYELCLERLGLGDRSRVATVGDSFHTDIAGGTAAGIDTILCTAGIHGEELGVGYGDLADPARVAEVAAREGVTPTAYVPAFRW